MRFTRRVKAGFVRPLQLPGDEAKRLLSVESLREFLPARLQTHLMADTFLAAAVEVAEDVADLAGYAPVTPKSMVRSQLERIEFQTHQMLNEMRSLSESSTAFEALDVHFDYLRIRARSVGPTKNFVPAVPAIPAGRPGLAALLARLHEDLQALKLVCGFAAERIETNRNPDKGYERLLVKRIAGAYLQCFGARPPKRSWFADDFIAHLGEVLGMNVGHRVVGEVVGELK